jgi:hypothetical protein
VTTLLAFVLWMAVIENGFLAHLFPDLLTGGFGFIVASFYSAVITIAASAGWLK